MYYVTVRLNRLNCKKNLYFQTTSYKRLHGLSRSPFPASKSSDFHPSSWASAHTSLSGPWTRGDFSLLTELTRVVICVQRARVPFICQDNLQSLFCLHRRSYDSLPIFFVWLPISVTQCVRFLMFSLYVRLLPKLCYSYAPPFLSPLSGREFLKSRRL